MLALLIFFLSGFAALLYQVVWQRMLVIFSGADVYAVTVVVAAFMGGLGAGSLLGGGVADRLGPRRSLFAFAAAEALVGAFGLMSKWLYYDTLYLRLSHLAASPALAATVLVMTLLVPTCLMGLSLPLLARALSPSLESAPRVVGRLYGWNTLGAATGAATAVWVLIPRLGLDRSLWVGAGINLLCAAAAVRLGRADIAAHQPPTPLETGANNTGAPRDRRAFGTWALIYGLTGFLALGLEIAWFRLLGVLLKSTSFTFGTLLSIYLGGLGFGAAIGARRASDSRRPGTTFLALQYGVTVYAALATIGWVSAIAAGYPARLVRFLGQYDPVDVHTTLAPIADGTWSNPEALAALGDLVMLYVLVPAVLIGPPTLLMGMSFAYLQKASQTEFPRLGRRLGTLLAANIAGGVLGSVTVAWALLPALGTAGTLRVLVGMGALLGFAWVRLHSPEPGWRARRAHLVVASITGAVILAMPDATTLWARLHATSPALVMFDEDGAGLSLLKMNRVQSSATEVYVNGLGQSWLPYGGVHTALGALPAFVHPAPIDVGLIGLGSGDTAFAAAGRPEIQRLVSIEILGAQRRTLERFARRQGYAGLRTLLTDPRIEHRVGDGRAYLAHAGRRFDIIEADALRPSSAYAGNLYSREYFDLVRRNLKPGGLAVTWAPTDRIRATFLSVYPYVMAFAGDIWIGSETPIPFDADVVKGRVADARPHYEAAGVDILDLLRSALEDPPQRFGPTDRRPTIALNTDMFPRDEFALPFWSFDASQSGSSGGPGQ